MAGLAQSDRIIMIREDIKALTSLWCGTHGPDLRYVEQVPGEEGGMGLGTRGYFGPRRFLIFSLGQEIVTTCSNSIATVYRFRRDIHGQKRQRAVVVQYS